MDRPDYIPSAASQEQQAVPAGPLLNGRLIALVRVCAAAQLSGKAAKADILSKW